MSETERALLDACELAVMMLAVEARSHRENQQPKKAEAVEGAIRTIQKAMERAATGVTPGPDQEEA